VLAELHGKLDAEQTDGVDRREDLLTDAVFGAVRYLPPERVLGPLLSAVGVHVARADLKVANVELWRSVSMPGWPGVWIEPDVLVTAGKTVVVFEAKLHSPFSHYDGPIDVEPFHQLAIQSAAVAAWAAGRRLGPPRVVAVTASPIRPLADLSDAARDAARLDLGDAVSFDWIPWQRVAQVLTAARVTLRHNEQTLVDDVLAYMDRKGVMRVFEGFRPEDMWLVSAAQRVAADRVYPQIRSFVEDLTALALDDNIGPSQPLWNAIWVGLGASVSKPVDWTRSWVGAQLWPKQWPKRNKPGAGLALHCMFDFVTPGLDVGFIANGPGVAAAQIKWGPHLKALADELRAASQVGGRPGTGAEWKLAFDTGDPSRPLRTIAVGDIDVDWLQGCVNGMLSTAHLRVYRRFDPLEVTVKEAHEAVLATKELIDACPALWAALRASGQVAVLQGGDT
jgi:hypothetical protein